MTPPVDPILIQLGPVAVHWYGILVVTGILLGGNVAAYLAKRSGEDPESIWDLLMIVVFLGIIGARVEYVVTAPHWEYYKGDLLRALYIWEGGLRIYGGVIGGAIGVVIFTLTRHLNPLQYMDFAAPGMAMGHAIGRWGNFINYEIYGPPTTLPWGLEIPPMYRLPPYTDLTKYPESTRFHPAFLYESLLNLLLFSVLLWVSHQFEDQLKDGDVTLGYLVGYSVIRYFMDTMRTDGTSAQTLSIVLAVVGCVVLVVRHLAFKKAGKPTQEGNLE